LPARDIKRRPISPGHVIGQDRCNRSAYIILQTNTAQGDTAGDWWPSGRFSAIQLGIAPISPHNYPHIHQAQGQTMTNPTETAILAGGCFWGMQDLLRRYPGVLQTRVGYTGGDVPNATYRNHGNHAEAIEIVFDPAVISYRQILEFFFQIHDPSTPNRQGNDLGPSYRSAIYYLSEQQREIAEDTAADVDASQLWPGPVVTQIEPAREFWEAEPEHQDYLERIPNGYTCHFIRPNWTLPKRS
jgi:peptide-methionine (S)-S-oxide reductase